MVFDSIQSNNESSRKVPVTRVSYELRGVTVELTEHWCTIFVISPADGLDSFEASSSIILTELLGVLAQDLALGSWVILRAVGENVYQIVRRCSEVLPTYVCKNLVLLRIHLYFQEREEDGFGQWVQTVPLGRVAAVCHDRYKPKQAYIALVARTAGKYQTIVKYNWMLTKYIEELSPITQFDIVFQEFKTCAKRKGECEVHSINNNDNHSKSAMDNEDLFFDNSEQQHCKVSTNANIYAVITKVVSNPNVREAMNNYRPKELLSICETLGLKF
uniref:Uncharacterized protein n=1 Tax=Setaria digitata TaxID=48799 RepID=A0A915PVZ1_9BILA